MKNNFQVTAKEDGRKYWIGPTIAVCVVIYASKFSIVNGKWKIEDYILVHKRGVGCPNETGKWSVNCGYVNLEETIAQAAQRETYEETGLKIPLNKFEFQGYADPTKADKNLGMRFLVKLSYDDLKKAIDDKVINTDTKSRGGEENEVEKYKLIPLSDVKSDKYEWAFNHKGLIQNILSGKKKIKKPTIDQDYYFDKW